MRDAISKAVQGQELDSASMERAMEAVFSGHATGAQIAALLVALRMKGETVQELAAAARVMRRHCTRVHVDGHNGPLVDTCGTGGDGAGTFNISTVAAIVVSACGVSVAKHGNRAASSLSGSADLLEALGVAVDVSADRVAESIKALGIGFMFARTYHPAMRHAAPVRSDLGIRTLFNLLGPLTNPAGATHQLLGVYERERVKQVAEVLSLLGSRRAWVVHGLDGLDEVSLYGPTLVAEIEGDRLSTRELTPKDFGVEAVNKKDALKGGDARRNAAIATAILAGEKGPQRDAVVINAAAALCVAGTVAAPREGAARAAEALDSGAARAKLEAWVTWSRKT
jgi:anthranilate phosphoribosyltransferase